MPIHLRPLSRRQFLARSVMAVGGVAVAPRLLAARSKVDPHCWVLMADTHIASDKLAASRGVRMAEHLATASARITDLEERPSGTFILGDCAFSSGEKGDYATLTELLAPIRTAGIPVHLALGNHDHREHFWEVSAEQRAGPRPVAGRQVALIRAQRANWFVLDSLEKTLSTPGLIGAEQLDWLARTLDENRKKPAIILVHHNPGKLADVQGVKDTEELFKVLRPRKQVKAYIFGHTHHWNVSQDESGIHLINLPPAAYVFRKENPSGWIRADLLRNGVRLELCCIDATHPAHGQELKLEWRS